MARLKVAQIITGLGAGGAERLLLDMYSVRDDDQFDVRLISITGDLTGLSVYGHSETPVSIFDLSGRGKVGRLVALRQFLRHFQPDVIHAHMFHALVAAVLCSRFIASRPAICFTTHLNHYAPLRATITRLLKPYRAVDIIFSCDQHPSLNAAEAIVVPNGVFVEPEPPRRRRWEAGDKLRLLAVGRIADQKDPLGMLRSFAASGLENATLEFVGIGPLMDDATALARSLGVSDRVAFHGLRNDVREFLDSCDVFVMHSKYEGMPIALLEAAARAMPVIATPVGSVGEIIRDGRGIVAGPDDFANALKELAADCDAALAMGRRLHANTLAQYSITATTTVHEQIYRRIARKRL